MAVALHPAVNLLQSVVMRVYPLTEELTEQLQGLESGFDRQPLAGAVACIAVLPAVCEELAFRGFILSGFRQLGHKWTAIIGTSIFFGADARPSSSSR